MNETQPATTANRFEGDLPGERYYLWLAFYVNAQYSPTILIVYGLRSGFENSQLSGVLYCCCRQVFKNSTTVLC